MIKDELIKIDNNLSNLFIGKKIIIYGAGNQAYICSDMLAILSLKAEFMIARDKYKYKFFSDDLKMYTLDQIPQFIDKREYVVLIAVNEKYIPDIINVLEDLGFEDYAYSTNWIKVNACYRTLYLDDFFRHYGLKSNLDVIEFGKFKINYKSISDLSYQSMLYSEFLDIIGASIFNSDKQGDEGPYEIDEVQIKENDIVFDCGANVGLFSCVAASKGAKVYAFEPICEVAEYAKENAKLYGTNGINVITEALSDSEGEVEFQVLDNSGDNKASGLSTMVSDISCYGTVNKRIVRSTTIDAYMINHKIEKIDFIKADIEGAERKMLIGAKETLKKYGPKLSICTYHLPDDKEVLTKIIMDANSEYKIIYGDKKLYAYV